MAGGTDFINTGSNFIENLDIQLGAVEIKDGVTDNRAHVDAAGNQWVYVANAAGDNVINTFAEVAAVPVSTPTTVVTYTVPASRAFKILGAAGSGDADGIFTFYINSNKISKDRTSFQKRGVFFDFVESGLNAAAGDVIKIEVENKEVAPPHSGSAFDYWGNIFGKLYTP